MKSHILILASLLVTALALGCNNKKVDDQEPAQAAGTVEEEASVEEEAEAEPEPEEEEYDLVVSLDDIERAAEGYTILHDEDLSIDEKKDRFEKFLVENDWAVDAYADLMYDIATHANTRAVYIKKIAN
jgi:hypothetical protein